MVLQFGLSFIKLCIDWILKKDFVLVKIETREIWEISFYSRLEWKSIGNSMCDDI